MRRLWAALLAGGLLASGWQLPANAGRTTTWTNVLHNVVFTVAYPDDICGPRANVTTYDRTVELQHLTQRSDGSFEFQYTAAVTYFSDFVDPAIPDVSGRLTEVNHAVLTAGETFIQSTTFHDYLGDVRIRYRLHLTIVDGRPVVDREFNDVSGCP